MSRSILFVLSIGLLLSTASAGNWPNWRGPYHNGSSSETNLPETFSKDSGVAWKTDLPGSGASTPVVWENAVFLTSTSEKEEGIMAIKLNATTGEIEWQKPFSKGIRQDDRSDFAGPSAATDGTHAWFFTGTGDLVAYDFDGNEIWHRNLQDDYGPFAFGWTFSTSPCYYDGTLYMQVLQRDIPVDGKGLEHNDSYLLALEAATGKELWRHIRPSDAVMESREAFTTPIPIMHDGRPEILVVGGDCLTGHNPETGDELWRWGTWNPEKEPFWRLVPSPVYGQGTILACGPKKQPIYAIKAGGEGNLTGSAKLWVSEGKEVTSDVPTPLFYDGYFYILNGKNKFLSCVHPTSGDVIWTERIPAKDYFESSPTAADGKIYLISHLGEVFVYQAGREPKLLHQSEMGEAETKHARASISIANGGLFIRADNAVYMVK